LYNEIRAGKSGSQETSGTAVLPAGRKYYYLYVFGTYWRGNKDLSSRGLNMEMSGNTGTPLARLVLFMVCLSIAGGSISAVLFFAGQSQQDTLQAPENSIFSTDCNNGRDACYAFCNAQGSPVAINKCRRWCSSHC
jgi:hypothetical protein